MLATSREVLGLTGEIAWRVPSLAVPDPEQLPPFADLQHNPAVRLFVERAAAAESRFALTERNAAAVAYVCLGVGCIPLALELAAAQIEALSADQLAARLDQRFRLLTGGSRTALPRQQTLLATLDWSYDLLNDSERRAFNRLSVFAGGWTLEAAEAVCAGEGIETQDVLDLLLFLVRKSLVVAEEGGDGAKRYRLLETLRQYAHEQLLAAGETEAVHGRHASYYLELAKDVEPRSYAGWGRALECLVAVHDNLRGAMRWLIECNAVEQAVRLGGLLYVRNRRSFSPKCTLPAPSAAAVDVMDPPAPAVTRAWAGACAAGMVVCASPANGTPATATQVHPKATNKPRF